MLGVLIAFIIDCYYINYPKQFSNITIQTHFHFSLHDHHLQLPSSSEGQYNPPKDSQNNDHKNEQQNNINDQNDQLYISPTSVPQVILPTRDSNKEPNEKHNVPDDQRNDESPNSRQYKWDSLLVALSCNDKNPIITSKFNIPVINLKCSHKTNDIDCHEAVPFLQFIYDNYDNPPARKFIFAHGHEIAWHQSISLTYRVNNLVQSKQFHDLDYGPLYRCYWQNYLPWREGDSIHEYDYLYKYVYKNTSMWHFYDEITEKMSFNCCGTFFVASKNFKLRPKEEYLLYINRLRNYSIEKGSNAAYFCGRLLEFSWHLLLNDKVDVSQDTAYLKRL